ncbi:MAG: tyrosine--tRNA ligase [Neomegalonema sp.]|nr:tyrosine--tRNA ligase [Neomegalonema sp.]
MAAEDAFRPTSEFLRTFEERGYYQAATDLAALDETLSEGVTPGYIGFDLTAKSLHVGSLVQIMMLRWLQKCGHKPIVVMGGGTTKIGDPSGKDEARKMLTPADIEANKAGIRRVFEKYLSFGDGPTDAIMVDNADWLDQINYIEFLRDYGRHFSVNRMLTFDSVRLRLDREQPLSFLEFNYMLLQAYDFVELNRRYGCRLQIGGSDQWGNIVNGTDLGRRVEQVELFGLTTPLLTKSDGSKMGKTAQGAIWLDAELLSPYDFWQFWRNTSDADVGKFLKLFTELPIEECERLGALQGSEINDAKIRLANEVTTLAHGAEAAAAAEKTARETFEAGGAGADLPRHELADSDFDNGSIAAAQLFVKAGLAKSGKEAKRLIAEGGAKIEGETVGDPGEQIAESRFADGALKLSAGKKRHALVSRA